VIEADNTLAVTPKRLRGDAYGCEEVAGEPVVARRDAAVSRAVLRSRHSMMQPPA
jgi:hypothetical protein